MWHLLQPLALASRSGRVTTHNNYWIKILFYLHWLPDLEGLRPNMISFWRIGKLALASRSGRVTTQTRAHSTRENDLHWLPDLEGLRPHKWGGIVTAFACTGFQIWKGYDRGFISSRTTRLALTSRSGSNKGRPYSRSGLLFWRYIHQPTLPTALAFAHPRQGLMPTANRVTAESNCTAVLPGQRPS